jgi:hypothetical protein
VDRAQELLAEVGEWLSGAAADAPRIVDSVGSAARDAAADLPDDWRHLLPRNAASRRTGISPVQGAAAVIAIVVALALVAAVIQRSRRKSAQRRRSTAKKTQ